MTWLEKLEGCDSLKAFIQHTTVPIIVSTPAGAILWANVAFTNWSGYSLAELQRYGWKQITVPGDESDQDEHKAGNWDDFVPVYSQQKQFYRKNQAAVWGTVTPMRFPPYGAVEFCVTTWIPIEESAGRAMEAAMKCIEKAEAASEALSVAFKAYTNVSEEQKFIMNAVVVAQKHPRITWGILAFGLGLLGINNALEILKTANIVPVPARAVHIEPDKTP